MQFHLNGYRPGDPRVADAVGTDRATDEVDVLIVGCGPAGLTLAAQLAIFPGIKTRIVDEKPGPLRMGQADGIACRTMEMFAAFGFAHRVVEEAYWVNETSFWQPDRETGSGIVRGGRIQDTEDGLSEFPHVILNQARVHDFYLELMRDSPTRLAPDYGCRFAGLTMAPDATGFPLSVRLHHADGERAETVRARFLVGCDGARSGVRKSIGAPLVGDAANHAWGVMDVLVVTDFPDIRLKATVHSADEGSILVIPREGGYLVRLYIELAKLRNNERIDRRNFEVGTLIAAAQRILRPYTLDVKEVVWWSVYEIGQRLADRFDDLSDDPADGGLPRVFIAGDACHTHSPKAGQGMNVSMQDAFNLGWKLAAVITGRSHPRLLRSYSAERRAVAQELIDFDRDFARMFSSKADASAARPAAFQDLFVQFGRFTAGVATHYGPSLITAEARHQQLASGFIIGTRFHSAQVTRLCDARPLHLGHSAMADGRWRLFVFASDAAATESSSPIHRLCDFLANDASSPIVRHTPDGDDIDSVIDVRAIFPSDHRDLDLSAMPALLLPSKGRYGLIDYEKVFCAGSAGETVYERRGIDRRHGCIVIVRPDQYVAHIVPLDGYGELSEFFARFMLPASATMS